MLPGGMTPVVQLVAMVRSAPPSAAAGLLLAVPIERLPEVIAAIPPGDLARVFQTPRPDLDRRLTQALPPDQLIQLTHALPTERAVALLSTLPLDHLSPLIEAFPEPVTSALLSTMPEEQRTNLVRAMDPAHAQAEMAQQYIRDVADALAQVNVAVSVPGGGSGSILLAQALGWHVAVAPRHDDDGTIAARDAETAAYQLRTHGALAVIGLPPAEEVVRYCRSSGGHGRPTVDAVRWTDGRHNGMLARTLVGLFGQ